MKKRRKLNLKKVMVSKIDYPNTILVRGGEYQETRDPKKNCLSPSDTSPKRESEFICIQNDTANVCH